LLTKACTSCFMMTSSDAMVQQYEIYKKKEIMNEYEEKAGPDAPPVNFQSGCPVNVNSPPSTEQDNEKMLHHDFARSAQIGTIGFLYSAPLSHFWYQIMERTVTTRVTTLALASKIAMDAVLFTPIAIGGYFVFRTFLEGKGLSGVQWKLENKWASAVQASWYFWPACNVINFSLIPTPYRVLYNNVFSLGWNGFLSHLNSSRLKTIADERIEVPEAFKVHNGDSMPEIWTHKYARFICVCDHCRSRAL